jgi:hypothetical protein
VAATRCRQRRQEFVIRGRAAIIRGGSIGRGGGRTVCVLGAPAGGPEDQINFHVIEIARGEGDSLQQVVQLDDASVDKALGAGWMVELPKRREGVL